MRALDDVVLTIDRFPAHLAGMLDVPVWTLLHSDSDGRWMSERDDSGIRRYGCFGRGTQAIGTKWSRTSQTHWIAEGPFDSGASPIHHPAREDFPRSGRSRLG